MSTNNTNTDSVSPMSRVFFVNDSGFYLTRDCYFSADRSEASEHYYFQLAATAYECGCGLTAVAVAL